MPLQNSESSRKKLVKAAAKKLFFQFGLSKTSMEDIARQAGLAKPTLYYYYPSKEAMFDEIVIEEAQRFLDHVEKKIPADMTADDQMAFFLFTLYQDLKKYSKEMSHIPELMYDKYPHGSPIVKKINEIFIKKLRPLLEQGKQEGVFSVSDEELVLTALAIMTGFINLKWMLRVPENSRDRIIEQVIHIILNGIRRNRSDEV